MKNRLSLLSTIVAGTFFAVAVARADRNPDFKDDATPILRAQPQLIEFVHSHFEVKGTGAARVPGDGAHPPQPPFIFQARPRDSDGPFYIRLLVQPGPPGHILKVVDMRTMHPPVSNLAAGSPSATPSGAYGPRGSVVVGAAQPSAEQPKPTPSAAMQPGVPTADTPSGPIPDPSVSSQGTPDLAPPTDSAPAR